MIELIINMLGVLSDKQADVIIATIGFMSAAVVAVIGLFGSALTIMLNKRNEKKIELRKIKEAQYIEFLGSLAEAKSKADSGSEMHEINMRLSSRIQTIYLVGSKDVQNALHNFLKLLTNKQNEQQKTSVEDKGKSQDELYAELIEAMKNDLYGKKEASLESISFTVFI